LECLLEGLRREYRDLFDEVAAQSRYVNDLETTFKNLLMEFKIILLEYDKQKVENKRLESALERERRQKMAAVSILQGGYPFRNSDGEDSERTTIDDLEL
jgi:cell shape-determining protein MreC